jgi:hypothetical protein
LRSPDSLLAVKSTLGRSGVKPLLRESAAFLAVRLTREEIQQLDRLSAHVKAVWLDRPVSAAKG